MELNNVLHKKERKTLILQEINVHTRSSFADLSMLLNVSEDTIRRDLNELADAGLITKIRGGAMTRANHYDGQSSPVYAREAKQAIAQKALSLIEEGMLVLLSGGTTIRELIKLIPDTLNVTFVTLNPLTAVELMDKPSVEVIIIGGPLSKYSQLTIGGEVHQRLSEIKADLCLLGNNALDAQEGFTDTDWETVQVKRAMMKSARKVAVLTVAEKLNATKRFKIAAFEEIDYLITELDPQDQSLQNYTNHSVQLL
jgi:DeoR family transcriptional regulator, fructose operon transcriptional repressor